MIDHVSLTDYLSASCTPTICFSASLKTINKDFQQHILFRNDAFEEQHYNELSSCGLITSIKLRQLSFRLSPSVIWNITHIQDILVLTRQQPSINTPASTKGTLIKDDDFYSLPVPDVDDWEQRIFMDVFLQLDWANTAIGVRENWDPTLRSIVDGILCSPYPVCIMWGPEMAIVYNASYCRHAGDKHPRILGNPYYEAWAEVWEGVKPFAEKAYRGEAVHMVNNFLLLNRFGYSEECYYTWSFIPIRHPNNHIVGVTVHIAESTQTVIFDRRSKFIEDLAQGLHHVVDEDHFYNKISLVLQDGRPDLPLIAIYDICEGEAQEDIDDSGRTKKYTLAKLKRRYLNGCHDMHPAFPKLCNIDGRASPSDNLSTNLKTYLSQAIRSGDVVGIPSDTVECLFSGLKDSTYNESYAEALVFSLTPNGMDEPRAVAVIGHNPRRRYNEPGSQFVNTLRAQLAAGMAGFLLRDDERRRQELIDALRLEKDKELIQLLEKRTKDLRETEGNFARICDVTKSGIAIADVETRKIVYVNAAWYSMSGHPSHQSLDEFWSSIHPNHLEEICKIWELSFKQPIELEFQWKRPNNNGRASWAVAQSSIEPSYNGRASVIYSFADISAQKALEELLRKEASDALILKAQQEYFIDMTSHELRNPLGAIMHSTEMLNASIRFLVGNKDYISSKLEHDPQQKARFEDSVLEIVDTFAVIDYCGQHMRRLIDDTLTLSKLDSKLVQLDPSPFMPLNLCKAILKMFVAELQTKNVTVLIDTGPNYRTWEETVLLADISRTSQIIINLLTNAIKFSTADNTKSTVTISLDCTRDRPVFTELESSTVLKSADSQNPIATKDWEDKDTRFLKVCVSDNGIGMSETELGFLFQRFSQAKPRTHTKYGGSGLGLYISRMLTARLGGDMLVQSIEGKGSTFTFYITAEVGSKDQHNLGDPALLIDDSAAVRHELNAVPEVRLELPLATAPSKSTLPAPTLPLVEAQKFVLIVEDNRTNQKLMCKQLTNMGWNVATADNGQEAIDYILKTNLAQKESSLRLDLCLMDCEMPIMDGYTATRLIRGYESDGVLFSRVPVIAITANARDEQRKLIMSCGVDTVVTKPFTIKGLSSTIEAVMAQPGNSPG